MGRATKGRVTESADEAAKICEELGGGVSSRPRSMPADGKGGGVKLANPPRRPASTQARSSACSSSPPDGPKAARPQGPHRGDRRHRPGADVSITPTRRPGQTVIWPLPGGMDIEEVAEKDPNAISRVAIEPEIGIQPFRPARRPRPRLKGYGVQAAKLIPACHCYMDTDASLAEITR